MMASSTHWPSSARLRRLCGYAYQEAGHTFFAVQLPNATTTLFYDVASGLWHERAFWNNGTYAPHRSRTHALAFGMHIVGDTQSGNLYQMAATAADDAGNPIVRDRRSPHISNEMEWLFHRQLQIHLETGLGPIPPLQGALTPGVLGPTTITLQDPNGVKWTVTISDSGNLQATSGAIGLPQTIVINDSSNATWLLGISIAGALTLTSQAYDPTKPASFPMLTTPGSYQSGIMVSTGHLAIAVTPGARDPQLMIQWSDDGGHTWSNVHTVNCGQVGNYTTRAVLRRLGRSRDRVYRITASDPVPWRIADAYLKADPGFEPTERLTERFRKMA